MTTVFIDDRSAKGKSLLRFLKTLEVENFIRFTFEPNDETKKAIEEARKGKLKSPRIRFASVMTIGSNY